MNLKKLLFLLFGTLPMCISANAQRVEYTKEDSLRVMTLLQKAACETAGKASRGDMMVYFAREIKDMNIPYVAHTLEPFDKERLIVNLRQMDCTTYTETVTALTLCMKDSSVARQATPTEGKKPHFLSAPKREEPSQRAVAVSRYLSAKA